ncbi:unnamed protein product [Absidia cylindrospora]
MVESNNQSDNQARQKQDIQKLLSGQSLSTPPPASVATATSSKPNAPLVTSIPSTETTTTPLREDKLALAVSFLSSPKVQSADQSKKTAFLKQKGLTNPEIEEAYRRTSSDGAQANTPTPSPATNTARPTPGSTLPPVVPIRAPPTRPTQIVYYSTPEPERLTGKRMVALALIFGAGAMGLTAGLVGIVKVLISPIFNSIAGYQRHRYNDRYDKLQRLGDTLRQQLNPEDEEDDGMETQSTGYWSSLIKEQRSLMDRLERLVSVSQTHVAEEQEPYGKFKNTLLDLKEVLNRPEYNFSTYTPYSMYGSTFANRSNTGFDDTAVQGVKSEIRSFKGMLLSRRNFPTAHIKPLSSVVVPSATTTTTTKEDDPSVATTTTTTTTTPSTTYHPRQRQNSYRAELQAKSQAAETTTTTDEQPDVAEPNTKDDDNKDTKGKSTVMEDISETNASG